MPVLSFQQRKVLDDACVKGRRASEQAVRAALGSLAVSADRPPAHLGEEDRRLRRGLRAKSRQLGDQGDKLDLLIAECAYEQWHRLLFARFLAENNLLIHPEYRAPVTLEDCVELAESLGEQDGWSVAGRFAAEILPGIFRLDDPCVQLRLAPEGRLALEGIVAGLVAEIFLSDDALGWVYQYWQKEQKDEVNRSERKVSGADIGPVTQLFTEHYMVRFLLENSLGAWWATRHPDSPLNKQFEYLRVDEAGLPVARQFKAWPDRVAQVTVMDPCCGSGHFLVEAFKMLSCMRAEDDDLDIVAAQDAVLRENLFGLELDARCVQIATFALAVQAWKSSGCWRELPLPNVACSGLPLNAPSDEWTALAAGDGRLKDALARLHVLFKDADTLGSLIDPKRAAELSALGDQKSLDDVDWDDVAPLFDTALSRGSNDRATAVLGANATGGARAANFLSRHYTLVATNVPYLGMNNQGEVLARFLALNFKRSKADLATACVERWGLQAAATCAVVLPQNWMYIKSYQLFREDLLRKTDIHLLARLGPLAFSSFGGEVVQPVLVVFSRQAATESSHPTMTDLDATQLLGLELKAKCLRSGPMRTTQQQHFLKVPDFRIVPDLRVDLPFLEEFADSYWGIGTGDGERFQRRFWEVPLDPAVWSRFHQTFGTTAPYVGRTGAIHWCRGDGPIQRESVELGNRPTRGDKAWGRSGVAINQTGNLEATLYGGDIFQAGVAAIIPRTANVAPAIWEFCRSGEYRKLVRKIDPKLGVMNATLLKVPFDVEHWKKVAEGAGPAGEASSDDPTQWLFMGRPENSVAPLQVAVSRLVGFRWPDQPKDDLDELVDHDGLVCLPSVRGERTAAERLQEVLARAFGETWSPARIGQLLAASGSTKKDLEVWLREDFFRAHSQLFKHRPFVWQIWDGRKDGFSALINYLAFDRSKLEKLTYSYLGDWIERQAAGIRDDVAGAEERLAGARALQQKLELILGGEPPHDIYVRWKSLSEQPIGWQPDLNDGVRVNIRPFVTAGILRSKVNVRWDRDRGANPDGSDRLNNLHFTNAQKQAVRGASA
jgi:hypothetical protein